MKHIALGISMSCIFSVAGARAEPSPARPLAEVEQLAEPTISSLSTERVGRSVFRALTGIERGIPFLSIEELGWARPGRVRNPSTMAPLDGGDASGRAGLRARFDDEGGRRGVLAIRTQRRISMLQFDDTTVDSKAFEELSQDGWRDGRLYFTAKTSRATYRCSVGTVDASPARCKGAWQIATPPPVPFPGPVSSEGSEVDPKEAKRACRDAFVAQPHRGRCEKLVATGGSSMAAAVRHCDEALSSNQEALACIGKAAEYERDVTALLRQCGRFFSVGEDLVSCLQTMAERDLPPDTVAACDSAVVGPKDRLRCLQDVATAPMDPLAEIRRCKRGGQGTAAFLRCIHPAP